MGLAYCSLYIMFHVTILCETPIGTQRFLYLEELCGSITIDGRNVSASFIGLRIGDLNSVELDSEFLAIANQQKDCVEFQQSLLKVMRDRRYCVDAYALANQLYPTKKLEIVQGPFFWSSRQNEGVQIPIRVVSGQMNMTIDASTDAFRFLSADYWDSAFRDLNHIDSLEKAQQYQIYIEEWKRNLPGQ